VHAGEGAFDVVIQFSDRAAGFDSRKKWHESQQLREPEGRGSELRMKLSSLQEIERWVLSWGGDAKVLKPKELVDAVRQAAEKILRGKARFRSAEHLLGLFSKFRLAERELGVPTALVRITANN